MQNHKPIVVIIGPTGSGKTAAAIDTAQRIGGEIIAADSRTVYRGMSIGTAKPTMRERQGVPHFGFDLVSPDERIYCHMIFSSMLVDALLIFIGVAKCQSSQEVQDCMSMH